MLTLDECIERTKGMNPYQLCTAYKKLFETAEWDESLLGRKPRCKEKNPCNYNEALEKLFPSSVTLRERMLTALMFHFGRKMYEKTREMHIDAIAKRW